MKVDFYQGYLYDDSIPKAYNSSAKVIVKGEFDAHNASFIHSAFELQNAIEMAILTNDTSFNTADFEPFDYDGTGKFKVIMHLTDVDDYYNFELAAVHPNAYKDMVEREVSQGLGPLCKTLKIKVKDVQYW